MGHSKETIKNHLHTTSGLYTSECKHPSIAVVMPWALIRIPCDYRENIFLKMHDNAIFSLIRGVGVRRLWPMLDPPLDEGQHSEDKGQHCADEGQHCEDEGQHCEDEGQHCEDEGQHCEDEGQHCED